MISGGIDLPGAWCDGIRHYENAVKSLIVPDGVKGFADEFLRGWAVTESFILPNTIKSIEGNNIGCVFADCYLPEVKLPESTICLGTFAFGHAYIRKLVVPLSVKSEYRRQFKDTTIEELYLPKAGLEALKQSNRDYEFYRNFYCHCKCNIIEY
ncbi:MAG: leucine-rich repeat domain-containing protein [Muribaculaceae bacterium]